ncbi:MAG: hypothetical protein WCC92_22355, partial [Candidatus Korobacteraceae bacterium]
ECGLSSKQGKLIRSIPEASEVTRPWRTLNISKSSSKGFREQFNPHQALALIPSESRFCGTK